MSLRLFEEAPEVTETVLPASPSLAERILFGIWASLTVLIPALASGYSALRVVQVFRGMTNAESAGMARVVAQLHHSNTTLIIALAVAAFLALGLALVLAIDERRRTAAVGWPLSIGIPIFAATPAVLLFWVESYTLDVLAGKVTGVPVAEVAATVSALLFSALVAAVVVQAATVLCAIISVFIPLTSRRDAYSAARAFVWAITGIVLLVLAAALFVLV